MSNVTQPTYESSFKENEDLPFPKDLDNFKEVNSNIPTLIIKNSNKGSYFVQAQDKYGYTIFEEGNICGDVEQVVDYYTFDKII